MKRHLVLAVLLLALTGCASGGGFKPIYGNPQYDPYANNPQAQEEWWRTLAFLLGLGLLVGAL